MTPEQAQDSLDNDPDIRGSHRFAISVLIDAAVAAERERCAAVADAVADALLANARKAGRRAPGDALRAACERDGARLAAARIREGGAG